MDDPIYIDIARQILKTPWQPYDLPYVFEGRSYPDMASHSHPPFVDYWIAFLMWAGGSPTPSAVTLHLGFLIFPLLFSVGIYRLARRFTNFPTLTAAVAICSPAAIVASHTLMTDYPCLAMSTLALALFIDGTDRGDARLVWIAAIPLVVAAFCSYPALVLAMLCWLYVWLKRPTIRASLYVPLVPFMLMAMWLTYSSIYFGRFILGRTAAYVVNVGGLGGSAFAYKIVVSLVFLAGTLILPVPLIREVLRRRVLSIFCGVAAAIIVLYYTAGTDYTKLQRTLLLTLLVVGLATVIGGIIRGWAATMQKSKPEYRRDLIFLLSWAVAVILPIVILYTSAMSRYLLPLLPPITMIAFHSLSGKSYRIRRDALITTALGMMIGLTFSVVDFQAATVSRDIGSYFGDKLSAWRRQTRFGGEWGVRHYMLEQGFRQFLTDGADLRGGDLIIVPSEAVPYAVSAEVQSMLVPVTQRSWHTSIPLRLMSQGAHAGFYSSSWGMLPFSFSRAPVEQATVRQISYLVERLPEIRLENAPEEATLLPTPGPNGGLDVVAPAPSRIEIPYEGPLPVHVEFSYVAEQDAQSSITVTYRDGARDNKIAVNSKAGITSFDITDKTAGVIRLDLNGKAESKAILRNWVMVPPGLLP